MFDNKTTLKEIIQSLTLIQLWGLIFAAGSVISAVFYLGTYVEHISAELKINAVKKDLQFYRSEWAIMKPQSELVKSFNFKNQVVSPYGNFNLPENIESIHNKFLTIKNIPGLIFSESNYYSYIHQQVNVKISKCSGDIYKHLKIYLWREKDEYELIDNMKKKRIFANFYIEKIGKPKLKNSVLDLFSCYLKTDHSDERKKSELEDPKKLNKTFKGYGERIHDIDIIGLYWSYMEAINLIETINNDKIDWDNVQVEKTKNTLFATNLYTYKGYEITYKGKKRKQDLFVKNQVILIDSGRYIYLINIVTPYFDSLNSKIFDAKANRWLSALRLYE